MKDYYKILNINRNSSIDVIKQAYREKAKLLHPDIINNKENIDNNKNTENFILLQEAYNILSKPILRKQYDVTLPINNRHIPRIFKKNNEKRNCEKKFVNEKNTRFK
eukprot:GHVL01016011.1.p1 GENE.GHVL01016011.1~~GHVL01016011.1.p1  ORF type:complete len:107 (+),score=38.43 GHVL01016011.1:67-387(+)